MTQQEFEKHVEVCIQAWINKEEPPHVDNLFCWCFPEVQGIGEQLVHHPIMGVLQKMGVNLENSYIKNN